MTTVADRLHQALEGADRSIRSVQRELHDAGVPGSSYANTHAYFSGKTTPTVEFLDAAGKALGVSPAWLAFGEPFHRTEAATVAAAGQERAQPSDIEEDVTRALREGFPFIDHLEQGAPLTAAWQAWEVVALRHTELGSAERLPFVEVAGRVAAAFQAPLDSLGIDRGELSMWQLDTYARLVGQALEVVTITPRDLKPMRPTLEAIGAIDKEEDTDG